MILFDDGFISEFMDEHVVCITGRLGSGKSCFAMELVEHFLKRDYYLATNMSTIWNDDISKIPLDKKMIGVVDEGGIYVRTSRTANALSAFLRKTQSKLIFSGKKLPHESLSGLQIYLWFDFWKNLAVPLKLWRWDNKVQVSKRYHGFLWQTGWQDYYGIYSSVDPGDFPEKVVDLFETRARELFARYGRTYKVQDVATGDEGSDTQTEFARDMAGVAEEITGALPLLKGKGGRGVRN